MIQLITVTPGENGTAVVTLSPVDQNGTAVTFSQLKTPACQLMRDNETHDIINDRDFATFLLTSLTFVLQGDDLAAFGDGDGGGRFLSFHAKYDSEIDGVAYSDLPLTGECKFNICKFVGQADTVA